MADDDEQQRQQLRKLLRVVTFLRTHDTELSLQTLGCFLLVALEEGQSIKAIGEKLGLTQSSASRNVSVLTERTWKRTVGLKVAEYRTDYVDITMKRIYLTPLGKRWAEMLFNMLKGDNP